MLATPLVAAGDALAAQGWYRGHEGQVPASLITGISVADFLRGEVEAWAHENARRVAVAPFNVLVGALLALAYARLVARLTGSRRAGLGGGLLLAVATPYWHYAGTFFTEPLTTLLTVLALERLLAADPRLGEPAAEPRRAFLLAGGFLGAACLSHITSLLWIPFLAALAGEISCARGRGPRGAGEFLLGTVPALALLAWIHQAHFGSPLETGRTAAGGMRYADFTDPRPGALGLLLSPSKGLFLHCPLALLGLACWRRLHAHHRALAACLLGAAAFRWLFIASRSDWHGGFCLGPRLLLVLVPVLLLPLTLVLAEEERPAGAGRALALAGLALAVAQQVHLVVGEVFRYSYLVHWSHLTRGVNLLVGDAIYWDWGSAVVLDLPLEPAAPALLGLAGLPGAVQAALLFTLALLGAWWVTGRP